mgnify:CR=1 FL=1
MYRLNKKLAELEQKGEQIKVALVGAGHMGNGMVSQMTRMKGIEATVVVDINIELAKKALLDAGINENKIVEVSFKINSKSSSKFPNLRGEFQTFSSLYSYSINSLFNLTQSFLSSNVHFLIIIISYNYIPFLILDILDNFCIAMEREVSLVHLA